MPAFIGGSLVLDKTGVLTGTISTHKDGSPADDIEETTLVHGKMDSGKELILGVVRKNNNTMDLVTFIRKSATPFALSDLDGDWFGFHHYTNGAGTTDNWSVDLTIQDGAITNSDWKSVLANLSGKLLGLFAVNNTTGKVSWELMSSHMNGNANIKSNLTSQSGQFTENKSVFAGVDIRNNASMDFGIYLKEDGATYQTIDLQGTWAGYFFEILDETAYWIYGSVILDSEGHCLEGSWESVSGTKGTFTGGTVGLDSAGKLSGTLTSSDSQVMTIQSGFMNGGKSIIAATILKGNGASDLVYFLKMDAGFSWPMFLPAMTAKSPSSPAPTPPATATFSISSSSFSNNQVIPDQYTLYGANTSPQLSWANAPAGTASFMLTVIDPDGDDWLHWKVKLPAIATSFAENDGASGGAGLPAGSIRYNNTFAGLGISGTNGTDYDGPRPPAGSGVHHYNFKVTALDAENNELGSVTLTGIYEQP